MDTKDSRPIWSFGVISMTKRLIENISDFCEMADEMGFSELVEVDYRDWNWYPTTLFAPEFRWWSINEGIFVAGAERFTCITVNFKSRRMRKSFASRLQQQSGLPNSAGVPLKEAPEDS